MADDPAHSISESETSELRKPKVVARYSLGYQPPYDVNPILERMIASVPPKYLVGLGEVVLTNANGLSRERRRSATKSRKRKMRTSTAQGLYYPAWNGKLPWIEIFIDNTLKPWERGLWLKIPFLRELLLGDVLFHEIGHHIHCTVRPEYREREDVADVWKVRLDGNYWRRRLSLVRPFFRFVNIFAGPVIDWLHMKSTKYERKQGWISQAEFEERVRRKDSKSKEVRPPRPPLTRK